MSGSPRSSRMTSGRRASQRSSARPPVRRLVDLVAARGQLAHEGRARLGVVLDDEDPRPTGRRAAHPGASPGRSGRRRRRPGRSRSTARPPSSLAARADAGRPSPRRGRGRRPARCRFRSAIRAGARAPGRTCRRGAAGHSSGTPGPASSTVSRTDASPRTPAAVIRTRRRRRRVLEGVLEHVGHGLVEEGRVDLDRRRRQVRRPAGRPASRGPSRSSVRPTRSSSSKTSRSARSDAGLDPAQVQEVGDQAVEVLDLPIDGVGALPLVVGAAGCVPGRRCPAAARIVASGVRRSCETDWRSADFSASLWRAISAAWDSAARRSWARAWPTWSAAAASRRVSVAVGSPDACVA